MIRRLMLLAIAALYLASIPWYRDPEAEVRVIGGLPDWVAVALGCYVAVAVLNALAWWRTEVSDDEDPSERA